MLSWFMGRRCWHDCLSSCIGTARFNRRLCPSFGHKQPTFGARIYLLG